MAMPAHRVSIRHDCLLVRSDVVCLSETDVQETRRIRLSLRFHFVVTIVELVRLAKPLESDITL